MDLGLYSAFLVIRLGAFTPTYSHFIHSTFIHWWWTLLSVLANPIQMHPFIYMPLTKQREQIGVKCFAQGHIEHVTAGAGDRTNNLLLGRRPTEPEFPHVIGKDHCAHSCFQMWYIKNYSMDSFKLWLMPNLSKVLQDFIWGLQGWGSW